MHSLGRGPRPPIASEVAEEWTRGIAEAAPGMDDRRVPSIPDDAFASMAPEQAIERAVLPAQQRIGRGARHFSETAETAGSVWAER